MENCLPKQYQKSFSMSFINAAEFFFFNKLANNVGTVNYDAELWRMFFHTSDDSFSQQTLYSRSLRVRDKLSFSKGWTTSLPIITEAGHDPCSAGSNLNNSSIPCILTSMFLALNYIKNHKLQITWAKNSSGKN